jgi:3-deoxy-D-manno-octulosonic-acid transferase
MLQVGLFMGQAVSAKLRVRRRGERLSNSSKAIHEGSPRILLHASSMGELEQILPLISMLKRDLPSSCVMVSCSSPSGYQHAVRQPVIDETLYAPVDTRRNVLRFLARTQPDIVVINRYDVWPNFVKHASTTCPIVLVNATYPSVADSPLLHSWVREFYSMLTSITAVTARDAERLRNLTGKEVVHLPDTRIDRVLEKMNISDSSIEPLRRTSCITLVVGSSWQDDEDVILSSITKIGDKQLRLVIVPHEPNEPALRRIEDRIACVRLSKGIPDNDEHILVDSVGKLLSLYRIADAAFVGGGFGAGVHSTTEPAAYGIPVACGPHIERSRDAQGLQEAGLLRVVSQTDEAIQWIMQTVLDSQQRLLRREAADEYIQRRAGSSAAYAEIVKSFLNG